MRRKYLQWVRAGSIMSMLLLLYCCSASPPVPNNSLPTPGKQQDKGEEGAQATERKAQDTASVRNNGADMHDLNPDITKKIRSQPAHEQFKRLDGGNIPNRVFHESVATPVDEVYDRTVSSERGFDKPITQREVINSIACLSRRHELGEQNAATANKKQAITILGETGTGKSTSVNYWVGCEMTRKTPEELEALGIQVGLEDVIVVDPESTQPEVASIGHGDVSHTFMPQIIQDPHDNTQVYVDCPGFSDNRGPEINIANAVNIRQVLQRATGIKAVFLTTYKDLLKRGLGIRRMKNMCQQLFGSVDNLRRHQNSVLLGINRAPAQTGLPKIRRWLEATGSPVLQLLANRTFLYDPLEQGGVGFWSRDRFLTEIEQMPAIPQQVARNLFQTVLTDGDKAMLQQIVEHQVDALCNALEQNDHTAADRCWTLLNQLQIIAHQRIDELMNRQVRPHMRAYAEERTAAFARHAAQHQFTEAEQLLTSLRTLNAHFPDEHLVDLEELEGTLQAARTQQAAQQEAEERRQREAEARQRAEEEARRAEEARQRAEEEAQRAEEETRKERSTTVTMRRRIEEMEHELKKRSQRKNH